MQQECQEHPAQVPAHKITAPSTETALSILREKLPIGGCWGNNNTGTVTALSFLRRSKPAQRCSQPAALSTPGCSLIQSVQKPPWGHHCGGLDLFVLKVHRLTLTMSSKTYSTKILAFYHGFKEAPTAITLCQLKDYNRKMKQILVLSFLLYPHPKHHLIEMKQQHDFNAFWIDVSAADHNDSGAKSVPIMTVNAMGRHTRLKMQTNSSSLITYSALTPCLRSPGAPCRTGPHGPACQERKWTQKSVISHKIIS